jgi:hypothetical protein
MALTTLWNATLLDQEQMHWAMQLHNELQRQGRLRSLTWDDQVYGPSHSAVWTSTAFRKSIVPPEIPPDESPLAYVCVTCPSSHAACLIVDEIEYGRGTASTRQGARDEAARRALRALQDELLYPVSNRL